MPTQRSYTEAIADATRDAGEDLYSLSDQRNLIESVPFRDGSKGFTAVVSGVTPTAAAHLATKGYVDNSGATASRPSSPATGQSFFDTTLGQPVWWDGAEWVDATGSAV